MSAQLRKQFIELASKNRLRHYTRLMIRNPSYASAAFYYSLRSKQTLRRDGLRKVSRHTQDVGKPPR